MNVGKTIRTALISDAVIHRLLGDRIYPILAPAGVTAFPYAVYKSRAAGLDGTKDGSAEQIATTLTVVGREYDSLIALSDLVKEEILTGNNDLPEDVSFVSQDETYLEEIDAYAVALVFRFNID